MKKQVVFIMTDSTRKDMLGCYGNPKMITPNLDRLAQEGIRYENAYTCQPVCGPARSGIFTGTFPHSNGVVTNSMPLGENVKTIGQRLTDNGFHCGYIGKWHLDGGDYFGNGMCPEGWDEKYWYDMRRYLEELTEDERRKSRKSETSYEEWLTEEFTYAHRCSKRALDFLEEYKNEDFFLAVSYDEPHGPYICPAPFNTMYEGYKFDDNPNYQDDLDKKPLMQRLWAGESLHKTQDEINRPSSKLALFLGCNSFVDYEIGKVLDKVRETVPNAMVIFTSDHGEMLGNHRLNAKNAACYKEIANVPLIIKGGDAGKIVNYPASHIDLVPTILDYMGVPIPRLLEGKSMLPQIRDVSVRINDVVYTEFTRYEVDHDGFGGLQLMRAVISDRFKLVIHLMDMDELYDMEKDPFEVHNLIGDEAYREIRNELHDRLLEHMNQTRDLYRGYQWACRSWRPDKEPSWANGGYTRQRENEEYEPRQLDYDTGLPMVNAVRKKDAKNLKR
nr:sulfatase-like hydrolase/transferase [uncultured Acetatifactor sp.]